MQEVIIQLRGTIASEFEQALRMVEKVGGQVLHAYPPRIIIASVPPQRIGELRGQDPIESLDTGVLNEAGSNPGSEVHPAISAWNEHIKKPQKLASTPNPALGLSWDSPGRLPPDPPPDIREQLRRREQDLKSKDQS